uniref:Glycosyltransferase n=1 Tax=Fagus sylvatica TaxID=28930 RepID=A0A2N9JAI7_FAGSY
MDRLVTSVSGMETFLRFRDLPSFCRVSNLADPKLQLFANETRQSSRAHALILNTFEDLEGSVLSHIATQCPKIYTIGPIHAMLKLRLESETIQLQSRSPNSLFEVDRNCMAWLDDQPLNSVIYVSFGSTTVMTNDELMEFWYGLVNSKKHFLWAIRPDFVAKKDSEGHIPVELVEGTKDRGCMVGWAPQEEVLTHQAVGGFLTHSGWNSILESIVAGVPMICWPYFADQQVNSRFVSEVWKLGMDMKDVCDRVIVEKMVNDLMGERREEFVKSTTEKARNEIKEVDGGVAIGRAGDHVEHCEEDRVSVPVEAKEVLVEEEDSDVGEVPRRDDQSRRYSRREVRSNGVGVVVPYVSRWSRRNFKDLVVAVVSSLGFDIHRVVLSLSVSAAEEKCKRIWVCVVLHFI